MSHFSRDIVLIFLITVIASIFSAPTVTFLNDRDLLTQKYYLLARITYKSLMFVRMIITDS